VYENQTFRNILKRCLDRVSSDMDKREGSIIYDAIAPAAVELAQAYDELDNNLKLGFASTSSGEWLDRRTEEQGVFRRQAVKAIREGTFNISVGVNERFFIEGLYYKVVEAGTIAQLECETAGVVGNYPVGSLLPLNNINGLTSALLGSILVPGSDTESDGSLLQRFKEKTTRPATSGNKAHYSQWANEVPGVGAAKVFPLWDGPKTVKVVIVDSTFAPASGELVEDVQAYIDPVQGQGEGKAPIGAFVTVESAVPSPIHVAATLTLAPGKGISDAVLEVQQGLDAYFKAISFKESVVRYNQIGTFLLDADSVVDFTSLLVNGGTGNVSLLETEIPVRGAVNLVE
jgi:uncharacterized phage protein gp47/JayE